MKTNKKAIHILLILALLLLLINPKTLNYIKGKGIKEPLNIHLIKEIELPHSSHIQYEKFNNGLLKYWDGVLFNYDNKGELIWSLHLGAVNPVIKNNDKNIYVFDQGKNQLIRIDDSGKIIYKTPIEGPITTFVVDNENYLALQHVNEGSLLVKSISIINHDGNKITEVFINEGDPLKILVSKEKNLLLVHTIALKGGKLEKYLLTYDLKGNLISLQQYEDIILDMFFDKKGNLTLVQEARATYYVGKDEKWYIPLNDLKLMSSVAGEVLVIYSGNDKTNGIIQGRSNLGIKIYKYNGELMGEINSKEKIKGIDITKDKILSYGERSIYVDSYKGEALLEYLYNSDIEKAYLFPNNNLVVITKERLTFTRLQ